MDHENCGRIRILALVTVLTLALLSGMSSVASAQEISIDGSTTSTPTEQRDGRTVDSVAVRDGIDTISVNIENYNNLAEPNNARVELRKYQITNPNHIDKFDGEAVGELDLNGSSPGSYWVVLIDNTETFVDVYPVIVPGYKIKDPSIPGSVESDEEFTIEVTINKKSGQQETPQTIEAAIWNSNTVERQSLSVKNGNTYTGTTTPSNLGLSTSDYDILISVLGKESVVAPGTEEQEPFAVADAGTITISDSDEDDSDEDDNSGDSDDSGGGAGGGQGGGTGGGQETSGSTADSGPPTPENVRDTLNLVEPASEATLNEDGSSAETEAEETEDSDEPQSSTNTGNSVTAVEFDGETQQPVSVTNYGTPPQTVEENVIDSIAAYNPEVNPASDTTSESGENDDDSDSEAGDGNDDVIEPQSSDSDSSDESSSTDGGSDIRVVSLSDVSPSEEGANEGATATVTFSIDKSEVTNPEQLTVYKEEYVFEAQEEQWIELETSVSEATDERLAVTAETSEFSLFAVTETISESSQVSNSTNESETNSQSDTTETTNQTPGFGIIPVIIAILTAGVLMASERTRFGKL